MYIKLDNLVLVKHLFVLTLLSLFLSSFLIIFVKLFKAMQPARHFLIDLAELKIA